MWDGGGEVTDRCGGVRGEGDKETMFVLSLTNPTPPLPHCDDSPQLCCVPL